MFGDEFINGQARKSLWIETSDLELGSFELTVRLVRACGSKLYCIGRMCSTGMGQARKSLWIETCLCIYHTTR